MQTTLLQTLSQPQNRWLLDMVLAGEPIELDTRDIALSKLPEMALWVSRGLHFILARADRDDDDFAHYRRLDAVWLTWLRANAMRGKDAETVAVYKQRGDELKVLIDVHMPELAGATAEIPDGYGPPVMDSVRYARS